VLVDLFDSGNSTYHAPSSLSRDASDRLADAIVGLLRNPSLARTLGEAGRDYALANFDWNILVERILKVYRGESPG
jgi:glycosyltransferase involved in cell wall biosynthesis